MKIFLLKIKEDAVCRRLKPCRAKIFVLQSSNSGRFGGSKKVLAFHNFDVDDNLVVVVGSVVATYLRPMSHPWSKVNDRLKHAAVVVVVVVVGTKGAGESESKWMVLPIDSHFEGWKFHTNKSNVSIRVWWKGVYLCCILLHVCNKTLLIKVQMLNCGGQNAIPTITR